MQENMETDQSILAKSLSLQPVNHAAKSKDTNTQKNNNADNIISGMLLFIHLS